MPKPIPSPGLPSAVILGAWWIVIGLEGLLLVLFRGSLAIAVPSLVALATIQIAYFWVFYRRVTPGLEDLDSWQPEVRRRVVQLLLLSTVYPGAVGLVLALFISGAHPS